ncbi:MAG: DUF3303 domain-containing protein [bacterium]|nr:DUF3303 domain-containing protein [bacterium]
MKFMATWSIDQDKWIPILELWDSLTPEQRADAGEGVKLIGRWHELASRTGVAIIEATDAAAVHRYIARWNPHMDMDVAPVLDDDECTAAIRSILAERAG